ncbi:MAG: hypothetical protein ABIT76_07715 [Chthoniobacterales bacterium]
MPKQSYMPTNAEGIGAMLLAFDTNINANGGLLALKYGLSAADILRITQALLVWSWFQKALSSARDWAQSLTTTRDTMTTSNPGVAVALPGGPILPAVPLLPPIPPGTEAMLEPGFFTFFSSMVSRIKTATNYDPADGILLGIEGAEIPAPQPATTIPVLTGDLFTSGHPELTCVKGPFQGYDVYLTRPGQPKRLIGVSLSRRYNVTEPLPAPGTAEVWTFEVQYRYQGQPFGQMSQPLALTVRG